MNALIVGTVAKSLVFQSPTMWNVLEDMGYTLTFAAAADGWEPRLTNGTRAFMQLDLGRSPIDLLRPKLVSSLAALLREEWGFVQVQTPIAGAAVRLMASLRPARPYPLAYVTHGFHFHRDGSRLGNCGARVTETLLAPLCDGLVTVCHEDYCVASRSRLMRRTHVYRLPGGGVDVGRFADGSSSRAFEGNCVAAIFCGELNRNKDPLFAVRAVAQARVLGRDARLLMVGDGPLRGELSQLAEEKGWTEWLRMVPHSDEIDALIRGSDVLLSTSKREGLPRVVIEALAAGVPVIARSNRGTRELLADSSFGKILSGRDVGSFAREIVNFDRARFSERHVMVEAARRFSADEVAVSYRSIIESVIHEHSLSRR